MVWYTGQFYALFFLQTILKVDGYTANLLIAWSLNGRCWGLLPAAAFAIVASTGDIYAGLWYPIVFAAITAVAGWILLPETKGVNINTK